ncbi:FAD-dependent oxidoreductase [Fluviispira multicolorata]|uniref:FAD-dependent oxidoreductase n=1 Tax=Fluviispira multicolorata TaxID=2654512 RepID=A0A833JDH3_9BACT|nr:FAD-dependent oxidoreductase [Fluviispira multicolorata]KAB8028582.1 FAD-dependent oxidoreductase [Fluviispira multicolorata]
MKKLTIVGSGILGLSIAEFFSRNVYKGSEIQIISDNNLLAGSYAASANLATKGQLFGRDKHFQIKLDSKKIYFEWLENLIKEANLDFKINQLFQIGLGTDFFFTEEERDKHFLRVKQNEYDLNSLNLPLDFIEKKGLREITYKNEAWVNAKELMSLLKVVLDKRKVTFINKIFTKDDYSCLHSKDDKHNLVFCTGAWTENILQELSLPIPEKMQKKKRLSVGSTFFGKNLFDNYDNNYVLFERISKNMKRKVTFSGKNENQSISSSTVKIENLSENYNSELKKENMQILELATTILEKDPLLSTVKNLTYKTGFRVGYGHSEIVVEKLNIKNKNISCFVCAGAHKSGFLFAPKVGKMLENILYKHF